ncbi:hypothetical protein WJX84_007915 [Apatococcus fuscideae]|uniref:Sulfurtransferase n=1 Tax=Apatococcus fuscideae TaxID=2026836 RepID=A0AAW1T9C6_9CHLO
MLLVRASVLFLPRLNRTHIRSALPLYHKSFLTCASMAESSGTLPSLVGPSWLSDRLEQKDVKILDGSWYLPAAGRDAKAEFRQGRIPGAHYFDMNGISDHSTDLPHMLPSDAQFAAAMDALDIHNSSTVVVYDGAGIFSAPRVFWTFKAFGHAQVTVLNGGMPAWKAAGLPVDSRQIAEDVLGRGLAAAQHPPSQSSYTAHLQKHMMRDWKQVLDNVESRQETVVDARAADRFQGKAPEPREGMRSGHIPGSLNVPFGQLLQDGRYKSPDELREAFAAAGVDIHQPITASCGSGVTACILALGLDQLQASKVAVYDGSWSEWGSRQDLPVQQA